MKAQELARRFGMAAHIENGAFVEVHYPFEGEGRADSGSIYYYVAPGEHTQFHRIDCDEYWIYNRGTPIEVWVIGTDGRLTVCRLGTDADCEPMLYLPKGAIFASRNPNGGEEGTFITCITVPRFTYAGFEMFDIEAIIEQYPECARFRE